MSRMAILPESVRMRFRRSIVSAGPGRQGSLIEIPVLLALVVLIGGCYRSPGTGPSQKVGLTPTERKKARLNAQIEEKFANPEAHFELGRLYQADGLWEKADYEYNIVLGLMPNHHGAQAALVKLLLQSGDKTKSKNYADIYIKQAGVSAQNLLMLGRAFQENGLDDYASTCYQQALRMAPNSPGVNRQIGYFYLSRNDETRALEYLKRSFQLDPYQPEVAGELGRMGVVVKIPGSTDADTMEMSTPPMKAGEEK